MVNHLDARLTKPIWEDRKLELEVKRLLEEMDRERQLMREEQQKAELGKTIAETAEIQSKALLNTVQAAKMALEAGLSIEPLRVGDRSVFYVRHVGSKQSTSSFRIESEPETEDKPLEDEDSFVGLPRPPRPPR